MKKILLFALSFIFCNPAFADKKDSLLIELDNVITNKSLYTERQERKIDSLRTLMELADIADDKISLSKSLSSAYLSFKTDSSLHYAVQMGEYAREAGHRVRTLESQIDQARVLRVMGLLKESFDLLDEVKAKGVPVSLQTQYAYTRLSVYNSLRDFALDPTAKKSYEARADKYRDSLLTYYILNQESKIFVCTEQLIMHKKYDEAISILEVSYSKLDPLDRNAGLMAYSLAEAYREKGDRRSELIYYAHSAITDIVLGVKNYKALRKVASLCYDDGDIDRAYSYMKCSMEDAIFCNARLQTLEASEMFMVIDHAYQQKEKARKDQLAMFFFLTGVLLLLILVSLFIIYRQNRGLHKTKKVISRTNESLRDANKTLRDANLIKEEYISLYMEEYSNHLTKITSLKNKVHKTAKGGGSTQSILNIVDAAANQTNELKEFYDNFDATVLHLFPNFPEEFDALLLPKEHGKYTNTKDGLSPELRIFALIRLGITDSLKISQFLRYSLSTIYNYRTKMRNKAQGSRDDFEKEVTMIGKG